MTKETQTIQLSIKDLRKVWRDELKSFPPPVSSQAFLIKALDFERQSQAQGVLSQKDAKRLSAYLNNKSAAQPVPLTLTNHSVKLSPGSRLVRNWNGKTYTVSVIEGGYVYKDQVWPSLSAIARHITGAHWSGPRFFSTRRQRITS